MPQMLPNAGCEGAVCNLSGIVAPVGIDFARRRFSRIAPERSAVVNSRDFKGALMFEGLFQPTHLLVIFGIALLVFGPKKLPELGKGIGEGIRGFKSAMKEPENLIPKATDSADAEFRG
jgi:sec-independent protein translocase protein TatA